MAMLATSGFAVNASAQSAQDFTLPPPPPEEEEEAEGPVDDSGVVPVAPRVLPSEDTSQPVETEPAEAEESLPAAEPLPTEAEDAGADVPPAPIATPPIATPRQELPATAQPIASPVSSTPEIDTAPQSVTETGPITFPPVLPAQDAQIAETTETESSSHWLWLAFGGLVLLFAAIGGGLFLRRRSKEQFVPTIEPPIVASDAKQPANVVKDVRVDLDVEVTSLSRSLMTLTLNCRVSAANRSAHAVRDIDIWADLTSAHRNLPFEEQMALPDTQLPERAKIARIGPHQSHSEHLSLQIPVAELNGFKQGTAALCVPLLRLRIGAPAMEPQTRSYAIGIDPGNAQARLKPVPLHVPPGSYPTARARALD